MKRSQRQEVLAKLKAARNTGAKRTEQYEVEETAASVVEEMTEEEYQRRVEANKKNKFIVDDFGLGYDDEGEVEFQNDSDPEELPQVKKPKPEGKSIMSFLKPSAAFPAKAKITPKPKVNEEASLDLMKNLLDTFTFDQEDDMDVEAPATTKPLLIADKVKAEEESRIVEMVKKPPMKAATPDTKVSTVASDRPTPISRKRPAPGAEPSPPQIQPAPEELPVIVPPDPPKREEKPANVQVEESAKIQTEEPVDESMEHYHPEEARTSCDGMRDLEFNESGQLLFYWLDAHEDRDVSQGSVLLFGKVWVPSHSKFESICVAVKDAPRVLFFQPENPEDGESFGYVHEELEQIRKRLGIPEAKYKIVTRNYAFELPDVPLAPTKYMKMKYSGKYPPITQTRGSTFKHVFGARNSLVENIIIKRKMKGPCWLRVSSPQASGHYSYCKYEVAVADYKQVLVSKEDVNVPPPPLVVLSLYVQTYRNEKNLSEVAAVAGIVNQEVAQEGATANYKNKNRSFAIIRKLFTFPADLDKVTRPGLAETEQGEKALLNNLMAKIQLIDPDMLIAHDLCSVVLDLLIARMQVCGCNGITKLGRLNRSRLPTGKFKEEYYQGQNWQQRVATCGRLLIDTFTCTKDLVKEPTYTLQYLAEKHLSKQFKEIEKEQLPGMYLTARDLIVLARHCISATEIPLDLVMNLSMIPLSKQLTNIGGNLWIRSLQQARAERNEMLLLHEFHKHKFICPDRAIKDRSEPGKKKRANAYVGGLVLEPKSGLYDKYVMLLDFNSLYPSIIQEYNICFTTVIRPRTETEEDKKLDVIGEVPSKDTKEGILPGVIKGLVERRRAAKQSYERETDKLRKEQLEIKQKALKLTANSMYGCLGFKGSRFYAMPIAALITQQGRNTLKKAVEIVSEELHLDVIYGDTDSIMINTNLSDLDQAMKLGNDVRMRINKEHKCLEIGIDGVFQSILLYKKKKYAAVKLMNGKPVTEVKGLDLVRRDWCPLTKQISQQLLDIILSGRQREDIVSGIHDALEKFSARLNANEFPLGSYVITKQLTKPVSQYADIKSQPHVAVAKKMMEQGQQNVLNHYIPYIICKGDDPSIGNRAYSIQEVQTSSGSLEPDFSWYINQQILPPVLRLCGLIEGTDCGRLALIFGQDPAKYQSFDDQRQEVENEVPSMQQVPPTLPDIKVMCSAGHENVFLGADSGVNGALGNGLSCKYPERAGCSVSWRCVKNAMAKILRDKLNEFYMGWMKCEECSFRVRQPGFEKCKNRGCKKKVLVPEMSPTKLHQIFYNFQTILKFDHLKIPRTSDDVDGLRNIGPAGTKLVRAGQFRLNPCP